MDTFKKGIITGIVTGALCIIALWIFVAKIVERDKIDSGYLIFENKVYSVELYDTLDTPEVKDND